MRYKIVSQLENANKFDMTMHTSRFTFFVLFLCSISACRPDTEISIDFPDEPVFQSSDMITVSFYGTVFDENNEPRPGARVTLHSGSEVIEESADRFGRFRFTEVQNDGNQVFLSVSYNYSYFPAYRVFPVPEHKIGYTEIKLLKKGAAGFVSSETGGIVTDDISGAKLELPAKAYVDQDGKPYVGDVHVAMTWINPESDQLSREMIGDFSGISTSGDDQALTTYGMLQVELHNNPYLDTEVKLVAGFDAELQFPVPISLLAKAPQSIPLWSFNESIGKWIEEGEATLENGFYVGKVSHFSSWNVDIKTDPIDVVGQVFEEIEGQKVPASSHNIYVSGDNISRIGGWLGEGGDFLFYNFPSGEQFEIIIENRCGEVLHRSDWGPYDANINIGDIVISASSTTRVHGTVKDCLNNPVSGARIRVYSEIGSEHFTADESGEFDFSFTTCADVETSIRFSDAELTTRAIFEVDDSKKSWNLFPTLCDSIMAHGEMTLTIEDTAQYVIPNVLFGYAGSNLAIYGLTDNDEIETLLYFPPPDSIGSAVLGSMHTQYEGIPETQENNGIQSVYLEIQLSEFDPLRRIVGSFDGIYNVGYGGLACDVGCRQIEVKGAFELNF